MFPSDDDSRKQNTTTTYADEDEGLEMINFLPRPSPTGKVRGVSSSNCREIELSADTTCGLGCVRGSWLQKFANKKAFIVVYAGLGCVYAAYFAYFTATITTMEKRFRIPSKMMGFIASGSDIASTLSSPILTYYIGKGHRPRWIGSGAYCAVLSCLIWTCIHFVYGPGIEAMRLTVEHNSYNSTLPHVSSSIVKTTQMCKAETPGCAAGEMEGMMPVSILMLTQLILGLGGSLHFTLGTTYIDDNIDKTQTHAVLGLSFIIRMMGPALGYWLSSTCLKAFIAPHLTPTINEDDSRWVGAYWIGSLLLAIMFFVPSTMLLMFPKTLPEAVVRGRRVSVAESINLTGLIQTFKRVLQNKVYTYCSLSGVLGGLGSMAYWTFLPKYIETQYKQPTSRANFVTGTSALIFCSAGILLSSTVLTRFQPSARAIAAWNIAMGAVSCLCIASYFFLGCPENDELSSSSLQHNSDECYAHCHCDTAPYSPVCGQNRQTFASPCHAGCTDSSTINSTTSYVNCSCVTPFGGSAIPGACPLDCDVNFYIFAFVVSLINFTGATGWTSVFLIHLRCVEDRDKPVSLGLNVTILCLFAVLPSQVLFGHIMDTTCLFWGKLCDGERGNCWLYDSNQLRFVMNLTAGGFIALGTISQFGIWYHVKNLEVFQDTQPKPINRIEANRSDDTSQPIK